MRIVIDPGHGGKDPGALSLDKKHKESTLTLQMATKLADYLRLTNTVLLTRVDDTYPSLTKRCQIANSFKADLFISIHVNAADNAQANGIETLVYTNGSKASHKLAGLAQKALIVSTQARDRGVKERSDLTVLKKTMMPAILVETGFITNARELSLLLTYDYQDRIVAAIADAINMMVPNE